MTNKTRPRCQTLTIKVVNFSTFAISNGYTKSVISITDTHFIVDWSGLRDTQTAVTFDWLKRACYINYTPHHPSVDSWIMYVSLQDDECYITSLSLHHRHVYNSYTPSVPVMQPWGTEIELVHCKSHLVNMWNVSHGNLVYIQSYSSKIIAFTST